MTSESGASIWKDRKGNVAIATALAIPTMVVLASGLVDYDRMSNAKNNIQLALDAATLASAQTGQLDTTLSTTVFNANLRIPDATVTGLSFTAGTGTIIGNATVSVSTTLARMIGIQKFTTAAKSVAVVKPQRLITATFRATSAQGAYSKDVFLFTKNAAGKITSSTTVLTYRYSLNPSNYVGTKTITPAVGTTKTITVGPYESYGIGFVIYVDSTLYGKLVNPTTKYSDATDAATWIKTSGTCDKVAGQTVNMEDGGDTNFLDVVYTMTCTLGTSVSDKVRLSQ